MTDPKEPLTRLGLHVTGDQSGACLLGPEGVVAAVAEERLCRIKRTRAFPQQAIDWVLATAGLEGLAEVDEIVVPWNPARHMEQLNMSGFTSWRRYDPEWLYIVPNNLATRLTAVPGAPSILETGTDGPPRIVYLDHHQGHLGWAYASPFERAAIAVIDEHGEHASTTLAQLAGNRIEIVDQTPFPHSFGLFYATMTEFLGFQPNSDEWKVMGAAALGDPQRFAGPLSQVMRIENGRLRLDQFVFEFGNTRFGGYFTEHLERHLGLARRHGDDALEQVHFDLAASTQHLYEQRLFTVLRALRERTGEDSLILNGGCAMNSLANGKVIGETGFERIYIPPAAADNGAAIGGPLWRAGLAAPGPEPYRVEVPAYLGPSYDDEDIERTLVRYGIRHDTPTDRNAAAIEAILAGQVVGWFQGRMEFGERALGARSILADPRHAGIKDRINASVKYREHFRPFAPSVLAEHARDWFDLPAGVSVPFMEQVYPVRASRREAVPAVVHHDGTGRLQTVTRESNAGYHALISAFHEATGVPILLNTSFNVSGEPVVCAPDDALRTFFTSGIDVLVLGPHVVTK